VFGTLVAHYLGRGNEDDYSDKGVLVNQEEHKEIQNTLTEIRGKLDNLRIRYYGHGRGNPTKEEYSDQLFRAANMLFDLVYDIDVGSLKSKKWFEDSHMPFRNLFQNASDDQRDTTDANS